MIDHVHWPSSLLLELRHCRSSRGEGGSGFQDPSLHMFVFGLCDELRLVWVESLGLFPFVRFGQEVTSFPWP